MFANVHQPVYGLIFWNDSYKRGDVCVQFYRTKLRRDKATSRQRTCGFRAEPFEVILPPAPYL